MRVFGKILIASLCSAAIVAGCKTPSAGGNAGAGAADGGMASGMEGMDHAAGGAMASMADAGASAASTIKQGASNAAQGMADAGAAAARDVSGAATTAADAARNAVGGAMDAGAAAASAAWDAGTAAASSAVDSAKSAASGSGSSDAGTDSSAPTSDGQIAAIAGAANQGDILKSQLAKKRSKNAKVKEFANLMIKDHTALDARAKKLGIAPEENEMSRALTQGAQDAMTKLTPLAGKEFDTAYVDIQVGSHEKVLKALDDQLIPNAKDPKLKALLQTARAKVQMHLEHAQKLQSALGK